jgi:ABC-type antimicrobial peptide transport system permease subunit
VPIVGVLDDAGYRTELLTGVIMSQADAATLAPPSYAAVELTTLPGAARQVGAQAALAWNPADPGTIEVTIPPDPATMRTEIENSVRSVLMTLTAVVLLLAVMALINTTSASVLQRRGEFGIRRALGARRRHIVGLVLVESLIVGCLGGVIGAYLGVIGELVVTALRQWRPVLDPWVVVVGPLAGIGIGFLGGLAVVRRAAGADIASALRAT